MLQLPKVRCEGGDLGLCCKTPLALPGCSPFPDSCPLSLIPLYLSCLKMTSKSARPFWPEWKIDGK